MISKVHQKLGTAGLIVAIVALVAALGGAAIAAAPGLNSKQKKQVTKIAKKYAGKPGAPGAIGPQGAAGTQGAPGAAGKDGTNGVSPAGAQFTGEEGPCADGGVKFSGSGTTFACNGEPGPTETKLPLGQTLKGLWQFQVNQNSFGLGVMTISFPLRVEPAPDFEWMAVGATPTTNCPGDVEEPKAAPGFLCVYAGLVLGTSSEAPGTLGANPKLGFRGEWGIEGETALAYGSWAVTAD